MASPLKSIHIRGSLGSPARLAQGKAGNPWAFHLPLRLGYQSVTSDPVFQTMRSSRVCWVPIIHADSVSFCRGAYLDSVFYRCGHLTR